MAKTDLKVAEKKERCRGQGITGSYKRVWIKKHWLYGLR